VQTATLTTTDAAGRKGRATCERPQLPEVLDLFGRLSDGEGGDLWVEGQPGSRHLAACGGPSRFLLFIGGDDYGPHNLADPAAGNDDGWMTLMAGGLPSSVEATATVSGELAIQAIRHFYAHGSIDSELRWA
jgi:hypothetical protein